MYMYVLLLSVLMILLPSNKTRYITFVAIAAALITHNKWLAQLNYMSI